MKEINIKNLDKLNEAIREVEGRATQRTITAEDIVKKLDEIEKHLRINKKDLIGIRADVDIHAQNFPKAYKYRAESTQFIAERRKAGWYIINISRYYTRTEGHSVSLKLTEDAKWAIIKANMDF